MKLKHAVGVLVAGVAVLCAARGVRAQQLLPPDAHELVLSEGLSVEGTGRSGRRAINVDGVQAMIVEGTLGAVKEGDAVVLPRGMEGERAWKGVKADEKGNFPGERAGWVMCTVESALERVMVLEARGHAMVYVNGEARMGDPYSAGFVRLPVLVRKGENRFLFASAGRGGVSARLVEAKGEVEIVGEDVTAPDLIAGTSRYEFIGVPVMNATGGARRVALATLREGSSDRVVLGEVLTLPACSVTKLWGVVSRDRMPELGDVKVEVRVLDGGVENGAVLARREVLFKVVGVGGTHKSTYLSRVDGSVQYYSVVPPGPGAEGASAIEHPGLVLSLHGASVEATSQASSYKAKPGMVIVCPTNRRPFGFDWEDWGRIDAIEVMDLAVKEYRADPARRYLTGHSMGGHGTWQLGVLYPERFAAIAPSAGWLSFDSYTNARPDAPKRDEGAVAGVFRAAAASSDTQALLANLEGKGIYILHGDKDDNVPVEQARTAKALLEGLNIPFEYHEQPGAGHWWGDERSGAACMDWPPIFEMFATCEIKKDGPGPKVEPPIDGRGFPRGSFKRVFDREFGLVYGTRGTAEENAWSFAKARFDAEQWWYRGNGRAVLIPDRRLVEGWGKSERVNNFILYGGREVNGAWDVLPKNYPVDVRRGEIRVGGRTVTGDDVGCLCAAEVGEGTIGVVCGTGMAGMRALDRSPYFTSGVGVPEVTVVRASVWRDGMDAVVGVGMKGGGKPDGPMVMTWGGAAGVERGDH